MRSRLYVVKCTPCIILASRMLHPVCYSCLVSAPPSCDRGSVYSHPFSLYAIPSATASHPVATWHSDRPVRRSTSKNIHREAGSAACDRHSVRSPSVRGLGGGVWPVSSGQLMNKGTTPVCVYNARLQLIFQYGLLMDWREELSHLNAEMRHFFNVCVSTCRELREVFCHKTSIKSCLCVKYGHGGAWRKLRWDIAISTE
jgi:hypothetical protein